MKKLLQKRQLIMATLVLALGAAVFINWYYTKPAVEADGSSVSDAAPQGGQAGGSREDNLGDSQYVHNPYNNKNSEYFAGEKLKRSAAHDEAKETLNEVITDSEANEKAVVVASAALQSLSESIKLESDCESLITAKTGSECLVTISKDAVQAVLGGSKALDGATALQIKEILVSKTGLEAEKITLVELNG
ncbi:MAG: SpoIIIAH-like family protein [Oscillospiraceae bacterium]|jgi:stage III sporulation protein AH|nr:SpoIIIAH-like family protein [Oscillospiraceae bacterium]